MCAPQKFPTTPSAESAESQIALARPQREGTSAPRHCHSWLTDRPKPEGRGCPDFLRAGLPKRGSFSWPAAAPPQGGGAGRGCGAGTAFLPQGPPCSGRPVPVGTALLRPLFSCRDRPSLAGTALLRPPFSCSGRKMPFFWRWLCCGRARPQHAAARGRGSRARLAASPVRSSERERCVGSVADRAVCFGKQNRRVVWLGKGL